MIYDLPVPIRNQCIWIVRSYEERMREYKAARKRILDGRGSPSGLGVKTTPSGRRSTEEATALLAAVDQMPAVRQMRAVDAALDLAAESFPLDMRNKVRSALFLSCQDGKKYPFERLNVPAMSKSSFFRLRRYMLYQLADNLGLIFPKS